MNSYIIRVKCVAIQITNKMVVLSLFSPPLGRRKLSSIVLTCFFRRVWLAFWIEQKYHPLNWSSSTNTGQWGTMACYVVCYRWHNSAIFIRYKYKCIINVIIKYRLACRLLSLDPARSHRPPCSRIFATTSEHYTLVFALKFYLFSV